MILMETTVDLTLNYEDLRVLIPIICGLLGFTTFWFYWKSEKFQAKMIEKYGPDLGAAKIIINTKLYGGFAMGVVPALAYMIAFPETSLADLGLGIPNGKVLDTIFWSTGLGMIMVFVVWNNAKKPESLEQYPQIRAKNWTKKIMIWNLIGWTVYLLGYEFLFRGVLFFPLMDSIGLWPAIAVNIAMYSATHIPKGKQETFGAIPFSIILCLITVSTGNMWTAALVHIAMAYTNTLTSFKHQPEMNFVEA
jgi:membrane protease YdiL (CAAX protease family)